MRVGRGAGACHHIIAALSVSPASAKRCWKWLLSLFAVADFPPELTLSLSRTVARCLVRA